MSKSQFKVELTSEGDWQRLVFFGPINEDSRSILMAQISHSLGKKCILDLSAVTLINSCGIRDWSIFLRTLKSGREIVFDRCPDEIVRTMNMVTNFYDHLPVRSIFRAYGCVGCGHEQIEQLHEGKDYTVGEIPQSAPVTCGGCGQISEAYEPDEEFFQFLVPA